MPVKVIMEIGRDVSFDILITKVISITRHVPKIWCFVHPAIV